jgi:hypothetical protein
VAATAVAADPVIIMDAYVARMPTAFVCVLACLQYHPDMDRFIDEYIDEVNTRAAEYNSVLDVSEARPV